MRIPAHLIEEVRSRTDLVSIISDHVQLKKRGANWWGLSPFTNEKTPSFSVNEEKRIFKCFSTGIGGDIFKFLMEKEGMTFHEAIRYCADQVGINIEEESEEQKGKRERIESLWSLNSWAARQWNAYLPATTYFRDRGVGEKMAEKFLLGWAPEGWSNLADEAIDHSLDLDLLKELGVLSPAKNESGVVDRFRGRVMFPIRDLYGHVVAFGGRKMDEDETQQGKYINSPESDVYHKSQVLYGLWESKDAIRKEDQVILVEGYTDVIALHQIGIEQAVASCGTAVTREQINQLQRFTQNIIIMLDDDAAGRKATDKAISIALQEGMSVKVVALPEGHDPHSFITEFCRGGDKLAMQTKVSQAEDWLYWKLRYSGLDKSSNPSEQAESIRTILSAIKWIPFDLARELYIQKLAETLKVSEDLLYRNAGIEQEHEEEPAEEVAVAAKSQLRDYEYYDRLAATLKIRTSSDFTRGPRGDLVANYCDIKGRPYSRQTKGEKKELTRNITRNESTYGVFIPSRLRAFLDAQEGDPETTPVFMVIDEVQAWVMCELGMLAVGLPAAEAFLQKKNGSKIHTLMNQVIAAGFRKFIYIAPDDMFCLPMKGEERNPYRNIDSRQLADDYVAMMIHLKEVFGDASVNLIHPSLDSAIIDYQERNWLMTMIMESLVGCPSHWREFILQSLQYSLVNPDTDLFDSLPVSDRNQHSFQKLLRLHDPQAFYDFHGVELGEMFQWGKYVYEVDRDGGVKLKEESADRQIVTEIDGSYWALTNSGRVRISDFVMKGVLKIKGTEPFVLTQIRDTYSRLYDLILDGKLLLNADQFHLRVYGLADCFFHGNNTQLRHLQEMTLKNMPQAYMLDKLGHQKVKTGMGKVELYVFGNGAISYDEGWIPADEKGLLQYNGESFFLPAESDYKLTDDQDDIYEAHLNMSFQPSSVKWEEWVEMMFKVHLPDKAHFGIAFTIMSIYRDIIYSQTSKIPNAYLQGATGSGKSQLRESLGKLFGQLPVVMVNNSPSPAAIGSLPMQVTNAWVALEEFNVFKMVQLRQDFIIDMAKGVYDGRTRAVRQNAHSDHLKNKPVKACLMCLGQEAFYQTDEAVPNRFVIREFDKRSFSAESKRMLHELEIMEAQGLGHLVEFLLMQRGLVADGFGDKLLAVEQHLKSMISGSGEDVLDRLIQNWAMLITPLLILIRAGKISYPMSPKEILDDAVNSILDHARKSKVMGIAGEFWAFIESEYGNSLDHSAVFVYKPEGEVRIRFAVCFSKFQEWLKRRDDKSTVNPGRKNVQEKLREHKAFIKESNTYMGYVVNANGQVMYDLESREDEKTGEPVSVSVPRLASRYCMRFRLDDLGIELREIDFGGPEKDNQPSTDTEAELAPVGTQAALFKSPMKNKTYEQ